MSGEGAPLKAAQLVGVSRYGHVLVAWTFIAAVLEAIAARQQPPECASETQAVLAEPAMGDPEGEALTHLHVSTLWQRLGLLKWGWRGFGWIWDGVSRGNRGLPDHFGGSGRCRGSRWGCRHLI